MGQVDNAHQAKDQREPAGHNEQQGCKSCAIEELKYRHRHGRFILLNWDFRHFKHTTGPARVGFGH